jgi:hypothetical protein
MFHVLAVSPMIVGNIPSEIGKRCPKYIPANTIGTNMKEAILILTPSLFTVRPKAMASKIKNKDEDPTSGLVVNPAEVRSTNTINTYTSASQMNMRNILYARGDICMRAISPIDLAL